MTPYATAQQAYRDSAILTAPPERLVVMLYDGANRFLIQGATALRSGPHGWTDIPEGQPPTCMPTSGTVREVEPVSTSC